MVFFLCTKIRLSLFDLLDFSGVLRRYRRWARYCLQGFVPWGRNLGFLQNLFLLWRVRFKSFLGGEHQRHFLDCAAWDWGPLSITKKELFRLGYPYSYPLPVFFYRWLTDGLESLHLMPLSWLRVIMLWACHISEVLRWADPFIECFRQQRVVYVVLLSGCIQLSHLFGRLLLWAPPWGIFFLNVHFHQVSGKAPLQIFRGPFKQRSFNLLVLVSLNYALSKLFFIVGVNSPSLWLCMPRWGLLTLYMNWFSISDFHLLSPVLFVIRSVLIYYFLKIISNLLFWVFGLWDRDILSWLKLFLLLSWFWFWNKIRLRVPLRVESNRYNFLPGAGGLLVDLLKSYSIVAQCPDIVEFVWILVWLGDS